jgi:hypothetical protein
VVSSVKRVTDIMSEIANASAEQSAGIAQVNMSIIEMDSMTQQNAALVEQAAAAAQSLQDQAGELARVVSIFKLEEGEEHHVPAQAQAAAPVVTSTAVVARPVVKRAAPPALKKPAAASAPPPAPTSGKSSDFYVVDQRRPAVRRTSRPLPFNSKTLSGENHEKPVRQTVRCTDPDRRCRRELRR